MSRCALIGIMVLGLFAGSGPARAATGCAEAYKAHLEKIRRHDHSPERRASLERWALRAYDACVTGDMGNVKRLFERLAKDTAS